MEFAGDWDDYERLFDCPCVALSYMFPKPDSCFRTNQVGLPGVYGFFGSVAILGALYVHTQVPETRGKSFDQIQKDLKA